MSNEGRVSKGPQSGNEGELHQDLVNDAVGQTTSMFEVVGHFKGVNTKAATLCACGRALVEGATDYCSKVLLCSRVSGLIQLERREEPKNTKHRHDLRPRARHLAAAGQPLPT